MQEVLPPGIGKWRSIQLVAVGPGPDIARLAEATASVLRKVQFRLSVPQVVVADFPGETQAFDPRFLLDSLAQYRRSADEFVFGLLENAVTDFAFGHKDVGQGVAFTSSAAWAMLSHLPVQAFLLYQCAAYALRFAVPSLAMHDETLGCVQDFCKRKHEFGFKLRTADFCPECTEVIARALSKDERGAIIDLLEAARQLALNRPNAKFGFEAMALSEVVDREYPFPIAWAYRAVQLETRPERRWFKLVQLFDVTFRYVISVGVALTSRIPKDLWPASIASRVQQLSWASLGTRQALACEYLRWLPTLGSDAALPSLADAMIGDRRQLDSLARGLQSVVRDRNRTIGHGTTPGGEAEFQQHQSTATELLELLRPWRAFPIVRAVQSGPIRNGVGHYVESQAMGSNAQFAQHSFTSTHHFDSDAVLRDGENHWVSLYPWVVWQTCEACQHETIWFYEGHDERTITIREAGRDHQVRLPMQEAPAAFKSYFAS